MCVLKCGLVDTKVMMLGRDKLRAQVAGQLFQGCRIPLLAANLMARRAGRNQHHGGNFPAADTCGDPGCVCMGEYPWLLAWQLASLPASLPSDNGPPVVVPLVEFGVPDSAATQVGPGAPEFGAGSLFIGTLTGSSQDGLIVDILCGSYLLCAYIHGT
ncbi:uncharacterized protein B0H64DRAFT_4691 [Chaetomium fimeti]|uniref:Uncharacterized protein n=1 Tax=Chaetomium fimeti TaxID=1854472 RepID=A0AAE0HNY5_9PEZI|nr:hypothetical protein B0H64DRAFT_4691 [Chaetomium fimeti]